MRPSVNFVGLPRMKPQPPSIGHRIVKRIFERNQRYQRKAELEDQMKDLRIEGEFEKGLQREVKQPLPTYFSESQEWSELFDYGLKNIYSISVKRGQSRACWRISTRRIGATMQG